MNRKLSDPFRLVGQAVNVTAAVIGDADSATVFYCYRFMIVVSIKIIIITIDSVDNWNGDEEVKIERKKQTTQKISNEKKKMKSHWQGVISLKIHSIRSIVFMRVLSSFPHSWPIDRPICRSRSSFLIPLYDLLFLFLPEKRKRITNEQN